MIIWTTEFGIEDASVGCCGGEGGRWAFGILEVLKLPLLIGNHLGRREANPTGRTLRCGKKAPFSPQKKSALFRGQRKRSTLDPDDFNLGIYWVQKAEGRMRVWLGKNFPAQKNCGIARVLSESESMWRGQGAHKSHQWNSAPGESCHRAFKNGNTQMTQKDWDN